MIDRKSQRNLRLRPMHTHHGYRHLQLLVEQLGDEVERIQPSITIDIGCGSMPYRSLFPGHYVGLDLTNTHGAPSALAAAEASPIATGSVDVVVSTQQLEHVDEPPIVLRETHRILKPGGHVLLSTHGVWPYHPDPYDRWRWTAEGLAELMVRAGFEVEAVHHQGELATTAILLLTYPLGGLRRKGPRFLRGVAALVLFVCNTLCAPLDWMLARLGLRHYASPSFLVVARRPA